MKNLNERMEGLEGDLLKAYEAMALLRSQKNDDVKANFRYLTVKINDLLAQAENIEFALNQVTL